MKGQELTSLEDWVLNDELVFKYTPFFYYVTELAKLLKSKPELSHFIPCDEDGEPLEKPVELDSDNGNWNYQARFKAYQEAESRVLWEGDWRLDEDAKHYAIQVDEDYFIWNKETKCFNIRWDMVVDIRHGATYSDLTDKGLIFKRDL